MNTLEKWCKHLNIAIDEKQKIVFWEKHDELKLGIINAELQEAFTFKEIPLIEIETTRNKHFHSQSLWDNIENENFRNASWESAPITELADTLVSESIELNASDLHLETLENALLVRLRIDGILHTHRHLPYWIKDALLQRYKILSQMDIAEKRLPQDGSFSFIHKGTDVFIRANTLPTKFGEKCVLRFLPPKKTKDLKSLFYPQKTCEKLLQFIKEPQGIFIVCGPTGSGKSSTLHAMLGEILKRPVNVSTVEDPIEAVLAGANQVQVNEKAGLTFATALRALLRQDPDVIFIGEIRDKETASIALQAARTGHLILATLHANSIQAVPSRLNDLGVSEKDLSECLLGILSQRLVRKLNSNGEFSGRFPIFEWEDYRTKENSPSIYHYAKQKVLSKETSWDEVLRVLGESKETI